MLCQVMQELPSTEEDRVRGWSPLHSAIRSGEISTVKLVLKREKVMNNDLQKLINTTDINSVTPLHVAASIGHRELVRLQIKGDRNIYR